MTGEFQKLADHWRRAVRVTDERLEEMIRQDAIDILVDLNQHSSGNRLPVFARHAAPVQVSFAGYPESTGVEAIQYRIGDRWLEAEYREKWKGEVGNEYVFLMDSFWCYDPRGTEIAPGSLPASESAQVTFGNLSHLCKINEPLLRLWARVLSRVAGSRLFLLGRERGHLERTVETLEREGIERRRVEFIEPCPRKMYLEHYRWCDIVLDTFPYTGHNTTLDALWMGVPVVSLAGATGVSRGGLSILSNLGLPELVANDEDQFVEIAVQLARDLSRLAELRASLRTHLEASVLMDRQRFTNGVEAAYRAMWRQWCTEKTCV